MEGDLEGRREATQEADVITQAEVWRMEPKTTSGRELWQVRY